jgi:sec-independent protein translocase protein TatA
MAGLGWQELVIVLVIIMIIFGAGKLPEVARSLGQGVKEFKNEAGAPLADSTTGTVKTANDPNDVTLEGVPTVDGVPVENRTRVDEV